jgi:polygalacturonase
MVAMQVTSLLLSAGALAYASPTGLDARASCTFSDAAAAISGKTSCAAIVIKDMTVPAGTTLDLTKLKDGTTVSSTATQRASHLTFIRSPSRVQQLLRTRNGKVP